jgi:NADH-quinone oxidoreductase subunit N
MSLQESLVAFLPLLLLAGGAILLMLLAALAPRSGTLCAWVATLVLLSAGGIAFWNMNWAGGSFGGTVSFGGLASYAIVLFSLGGGAIVVLGNGYLDREEFRVREFHALIVLAILGMALMASARDFLVLFVGLELMSLSFYVLAGLFRTRETSNEAALKYFLLGAFATGFYVYGVALIYGATGSITFSVVRDTASSVHGQPMFWLGSVFVLTTFLFKIAAVPFHMWAPDVYEGSPTVVSAFLSALGKAAALIALVVLASFVFEGAVDKLRPLLAIIACATMIVGNLAALAQKRIKRMLAYSSVAHAGYALVGLAALNPQGHGAILFYALVYMVMQVGAFGVVAELERKGEGLNIEDYAGLSTRRPLMAVVMAIFLFSLTGIPPFGGFFGKYYLFAAAVRADMTWLAIVGVLGSLLSVYYYLGVVLTMYFREGDREIPLPSKPGIIVLSCIAAATLALGLFPGTVIDVVSRLAL